MSKRWTILRTFSVGGLGLALLMTCATNVRAASIEVENVLKNIAAKPAVGTTAATVQEVSSDANGTITSSVKGKQSSIEPNACTAVGLSCTAGHTCGCLAGTAEIEDGTGVFYTGTATLAIYADETTGIPTANGFGECFGASAVDTLARQANATVSEVSAGTLCVLPNSPAYVTYGGTYIITGGTGPYINAFGGGVIAVDIYSVNANFQLFVRGPAAHIN